MTEQKFKLLFVRGTEEDLKGSVIVGKAEPELIVDLPENQYDFLYNSLLVIAAAEKREAAVE